MSRTPFVGGNFKCTGSAASLTGLIKTFNESITGFGGKVEVVVAPGAPYIGLVKSVAHQDIKISAQNCVPKSGAFTGEMSAEQVKDLGLGYVILGHSERRHVFRENDADIKKKTKAALQQGLIVIACVGETLQDREAGKTEQVVLSQLKAATAGLSEAEWKNIVVAYEPVWAIGTGKVASPQQAQDVIAFIRKTLKKLVGGAVARRTRIIYGGSVNAKNVASLWAQPDIDGFLVGGASCKPEFSTIVQTAAKAKL
eukprot:TRINITY_DN243_c0_g1_i2.p1 TRINITY_DN243_c0_g1~~TRINITY_DN243_c0_g1_i2.p1  ORF type:complete len:255 (+),score=124.22 TRINITY_DN243_c0_g1_i2:66-830(+)